MPEEHVPCAKHKGGYCLRHLLTQIEFGIFVLLSFSIAEAQSYNIATVAGGGHSRGTDNLGDGGQALMSSLTGNANGLCVDGNGNLYIADTGDYVIRKVTSGGVITVVAGDVNGSGYYGDGGSAIGAGLNQPLSVAADSQGNLYIADFLNSRVRKVSAAGTISTVAGGGTNITLGGLATQTNLDGAATVAVDSAGNLFIGVNTGGGASAHVLKVTPDGIISGVAGTNGAVFGQLGDGGPATNAFITIAGLAVDGRGNVYIADFGDNRIRMVAPNGIITTVAGNGTSNFSGDGGPATSAGLNRPSGVAVDSNGNLFIADTNDYRIRRVAADGTISTMAGTGIPGSSGDGGPAASATINLAYGLAIAPSGTLYFPSSRPSDGAQVVRSLTPVRVPPTIAPGGIAPVYSTVSTIQPGEWVSIFGSNLSAGTQLWQNDFPKSLAGTQVTINGRPAYLSYVSPSQINLQAPDDTATGPVDVVVTAPGGSATAKVTLAPVAPSFCLLDTKHVAGLILRQDGSGAYGGGTYDIIGPTGNSLGYQTVAAKAGDVLELFGVGFGPTNPPVPAGQAFSGAAPAVNSVQVLINNTPVAPVFAGISEPGLFQFNIVQLPAGLGTGDVSLQAVVGGVKTPGGVVLALQ